MLEQLPTLLMHSAVYFVCKNTWASAGPTGSSPQRQICRTLNIGSVSFSLFRMYSVHTDYVFYPTTLEQLRNKTQDYFDEYLPGAGGSVDVAHGK